MNKLKFASELIAIQSKILQNCFVTGVMLSMSTQLQLHKSVNQGIEVTDNFLCELKPQILIKACVRLS